MVDVQKLVVDLVAVELSQDVLLMLKLVLRLLRLISPHLLLEQLIRILCLVVLALAMCTLWLRWLLLIALVCSLLHASGVGLAWQPIDILS